ncbi:DNA repair protein RecN [uncultured Adlercreutzia sp.]|uniref:DNA repair protein RecN n=1 Tax=uncultured Adlercreutzia sp. TaxID=875803 RepID=UPI0026771D3C|nr:DNA repair protein RecN [uncultured Adlercreutzia sp.]
MIDEIQVQDIALIRQASLTPSARLTVLTGETGAGKTALISACKLLVGARADSSVVREGAERAQVSGRLFAGESDEELVITRRVGADGRSRATINGTMASVAELSETAGPLIELCGQHEYQSLLRTAEHGRILDDWAEGAREAAEAYRAALAEANEAQRRLDEVRAQASASTAQLEEARFALQQIEAVNPQGGEYEEVRDWLARAEHAETLARNSHGAAEALSGDGGALDALGSAIALIEEAARADEELAPYAQSLREASFVVEDVARDMAAYCDGIDFDAASLAEAQERMGTLMGLMRNFGPTMEEVFGHWDACAALVRAVDDADGATETAERELDAAERALAETAAAYDAARAEAAPRFAEAVSAVLARLEMGGAALECTVEALPRAQWTRHGSSAVAFTFRPGKSMQARPLTRIASGGEISRVLLAVKVVLGKRDGAETLIFDEVDAGVGGNTANALAAVLAELAESHQVIVITHLAQVAVLADVHYTVVKTEGDAPQTELSPVEGEARVAEVARLLSGSATDTSLAHARELLEAAGR